MAVGHACHVAATYGAAMPTKPNTDCLPEFEKRARPVAANARVLGKAPAVKCETASSLPNLQLPQHRQVLDTSQRFLDCLLQ